VISSLAGIISTTFQGKSQMAKSQLIALSYPIARVPLVIVVALLGTDALGLSMTYLIAIIIMLVLAIILLKKVKIRFVKPTMIRSYYRFALPLVFSTIVVTLATNLDKILIGLSLGDVYVGYYFSAQSFVGLVAGVGTAVAALTFPDFSRLFREKKLEEIKNKCKEAERFISLLTLPIIIIIVVFPEEIMSILFGGEFSNVAEALRWLALGTLLIVMNQPYGTQLLAANRSDLMAEITIVSYFVMIVMIVILVPTQIGIICLLGLGSTGAALSFFIFASIYTCLTRLSVNHISGTRFNFHIIVHFICANITGLLISIVAIFISISNIFMLGFFCIFSFALFYLLMFILREFGGSDIKYISDLISPKKMSDYITDEFRK
jgi:O-antigen/teichoic acid export membrane protein